MARSPVLSSFWPLASREAPRTPGFLAHRMGCGFSGWVPWSRGRQPWLGEKLFLEGMFWVWQWRLSFLLQPLTQELKGKPCPSPRFFGYLFLAKWSLLIDLNSRCYFSSWRVLSGHTHSSLLTKQSNKIFNMLKEKKCQPRILYPVEFSRMKPKLSQKLRKCIARRPALSGMLRKFLRHKENTPNGNSNLHKRKSPEIVSID